MTMMYIKPVTGSTSCLVLLDVEVNAVPDDRMNERQQRLPETLYAEECK